MTAWRGRWRISIQMHEIVKKSNNWRDSRMLRLYVRDGGATDSFNLFLLALIYGEFFAWNSLVPTNYALGAATQARRHGLYYYEIVFLLYYLSTISRNSSTVATTTTTKPLGADDVCRCFHLHRSIINAEFNRAWKTIMSDQRACVCAHTAKIIIITKRGLVAPHTRTHRGQGHSQRTSTINNFS